MLYKNLQMSPHILTIINFLIKFVIGLAFCLRIFDWKISIMGHSL